MLEKSIRKYLSLHLFICNTTQLLFKYFPMGNFY